jgi:hypothetical protein
MTMRLDLSDSQVRAVYRSLNRTLIDIGAECSHEWEPDYPHKKTDTCIEYRREVAMLERVLEKIDRQDGGR